MVGVLSEEYSETRLNGKNLFKQGKVLESFELLEKLLVKSRKAVESGSEIS